MAEEEKTPVDSKAQENAPKAEDKKVYNGKYNSVEDLEKAHSDLEQKLGQQGEDLNKLRQFQADAYPIIDVVYSNDEIMSQIRKAADAKYEAPQNQETNGKTEEPAKVSQVDPKVKEQESYLRQQAIDDFKKKNGLDILSADDYSKVENALTDVMSRWIIPGTQVPLEKVSTLLTDAYSIVKTDKLVEDKVLESLATQQTNQRATMSPMSGEVTDDSGDQLTETERKFAEKLGVKSEDVKTYKERIAKGNEESIIK